MLEVTGERLLPDRQRGELVHAQHLARYLFAARFGTGRRVLDAACGEGYGTALLGAAGATSVIGMDIDEPTINHASETYPAHSFEPGDVAQLPFPDDSFDMIVSFETLEHVQDAPAALAEFRRVLAGDGLLIASTPNAERYLVDNEFHEREFTQEEFDQLLAPHFDEVRMFHQQDWLTSAVLGEEQLRQDDPEQALRLHLAKVAGAEPTDQLFSVAVCGPWSEPVEETAVMTGIFEAQKTVEWVDRALAAEHRYAESRKELAAWTKRAREAERQAAEDRARAAMYEGSLSWRVTRPLRNASQKLRPKS
jgi:ubiquinone/menaquinone biosynthesis C-methylase UbiE